MHDDHAPKLDLLVESEQAVELAASAEYAPILRDFPKVVNVLLRLPAHLGPRPSGDRAGFHEFAWMDYTQLPHSSWVIFGLWKRGYFYEASSLIRTLIETFVQVRYFHEYPALLVGHLEGAKKGRVHFKTIFDAILPGYYDKTYGEVLSRFAHGKGGQVLARMEFEPGSIDEVAHHPECWDNPPLRSFVITSLISIVLGYLRFSTRFFPAHELRLAPDLFHELPKATSWLSNVSTVDRTVSAGAEEWYGMLDHMTRPK